MSDRILTILAGGTSRRFQNKEGQWSDKVLMEYNNKPLLVHLIERSKEFYDAIGISINSKKRKKSYSSIVDSYVLGTKVDYIVDTKKINFEGVLNGIQSSMNYYVDKEIQFIPSDRPHLLFEILKKLSVKPNGVSIFRYSDGMIEPLLALYGPKLNIPLQFLDLSLSRADVPIRLAHSIQTYDVEDLIEKNAFPKEIFANINVQVDFSDESLNQNVPSNIILPSSKTIEKPKPLMDVLDSSLGIVDVATNLIDYEYYYACFLWVSYASNQQNIDSKTFKELGNKALSMEKEYWKEKDLAFLELHALQDLVLNFPEEQTKDNMQSMLKLKEKMKIKPRKVG